MSIKPFNSFDRVTRYIAGNKAHDRRRVVCRMIGRKMSMQGIKVEGVMFYRCQCCGLMDWELDTPVWVPPGETVLIELHTQPSSPEPQSNAVSK